MTAILAQRVKDTYRGEGTVVRIDDDGELLVAFDDDKCCPSYRSQSELVGLNKCGWNDCPFGPDGPSRGNATIPARHDPLLDENFDVSTRTLNDPDDDEPWWSDETPDLPRVPYSEGQYLVTTNDYVIDEGTVVKFVRDDGDSSDFVEVEDVDGVTWYFNPEDVEAAEHNYDGGHCIPCEGFPEEAPEPEPEPEPAFSVGQKIVVTRDRAYGAEVKAGDTGTVIEDTGYDYRVKMHARPEGYGDVPTWYFKADVLDYAPHSESYTDCVACMGAEADRFKSVAAERPQEPAAADAPEAVYKVGTKVRVLVDGAYGADVVKGDTGVVDYVDEYDGDLVVVMDSNGIDWSFRPDIDVEPVSEASAVAKVRVSRRDPWKNLPDAVLPADTFGVESGDPYVIDSDRVVGIFAAGTWIAAVAESDDQASGDGQ